LPLVGAVFKNFRSKGIDYIFFIFGIP